MHFDWLVWSNPIALWWSFLVIVSAANIAGLGWLYSRLRKSRIFAVEPLLLLGSAYVLGCAFRSLLPRADVQRICLFDTWLSSVFVGRSVATVAELCFVIQWAIVLREFSLVAHSHTARITARAIVPLIAVAEMCSWYAVITTNYLGNVLENSLWTLTFALIGIALLQLAGQFRSVAKMLLVTAAVGTAGYVVFMCTVDVPTYFARWQAEVLSGKQFFGFFSGLHDVATRWVVTHDIARWDGEIAWMSLYFSMAVWASLLLAAFGLVKHLLLHYRTGEPAAKSRRQPVVR
jgi:hypothetical protein